LATKGRRSTPEGKRSSLKERAAEAIRLGRVLAALLPDQPEVLGLLALMLLHDSRRQARFDGPDLVLLPGQVRSRWDWPQISVLYAALAERTRSLVVRLNRAVAVAEADGPAAALALVDQLELPDYQYWHSTRAGLLRRLGPAGRGPGRLPAGARPGADRPERRYLERRIAGT
jgi:RNA polymerase sigma-70 factor (ECF subfamily)